MSILDIAVGAGRALGAVALEDRAAVSDEWADRALAPRVPLVRVVGMRISDRWSLPQRYDHPGADAAITRDESTRWPGEEDQIGGRKWERT